MTFLARRHPRPEDLGDTDEENDETIDPQLHLRTVRTAASTLAESIRSEARAQKRKSLRKTGSRFFRHRGGKRPKTADSNKTSETLPDPPRPEVKGARRNVYVNQTPSAMEVDRNGEPIVRYVRNKVKTSKYTVFTFLPRNMFEQFRRVANLYFLALVIFQVFPVFGAASASTAMLPLVFIITVTAIKDGIEDYRRASLDEEVNTSAATKLGNWRNVNISTDPRGWFEKLIGANKPGEITKGVRKLREKEGHEGNRIMLHKASAEGAEDASVTYTDGNKSSWSIGGPHGAGGRRLEDIASMDGHSYPPTDHNKSSLTIVSKPSDDVHSHGNNFGSLSGISAYQQSLPSRPSFGVVDFEKRSSGLSKWERTLWKKLEVGDIVLLRDNDQVPADIVVLSTSDPDGMCYLETKNLDGETNLKARKSVYGTSSITSEEDIERSSFVLDSEPPHQNLYLYHGVLKYKSGPNGEEKQEPVTINEFLLRGCAVRNTTWIIGLVVFTGADTKIMLNGGETPSKRSKIEVETNFNVIVNFVVLVLMCTIAALFSGLYDDKKDTSAKFFEVGDDPTTSSILNALVTFVSCLIAFQNIVPISLYISIEIVKTIQAFFIAQDVDMYYEPLDAPCVPKTWNISDDLGQIEYVFSDKTGTLTQNIMELQKCSINGVVYGEGVTEAQRGAATREGKIDTMDPAELNRKLAMLKSDMLMTSERAFKNRYAQPNKLTLVSPKLADDLTNKFSDQRNHLIAFFRALAICHSVLADRPEPREQPFLLEYKAESPDEAALVAAARDVGFPFVGKTKDSIDIEVMGQSERYIPLKMLEFNSTRKRMSVIVRCPDGRIILYCKGADSVIYERLAPDQDVALREQTQKDMESFANNGLRTLCIAYRYINEDEYLTWSRTYDAAANATKNREEEIDKANTLVEHSLLILGATALEDKLQEGVPEAIEMLHHAGIKLWILTGDKLQTAIEIGFSCNLLKNDMDIMILSADTIEGARSQIEAGLNKIASVLGPPSWDPRKRGFLPNVKASFAVVIDGDTLRSALSPELKLLFLNLGTQCETVVCCRVSPAQKALTVKLVKEGRNAMTLSIGDGANDVAMIQEANVGCGLLGLEGSQAAMSADYAFGQFRFLTKLLIVHGRWSYQRIADMHSNFFYKNVIWTFAMFWYLPFNSFDGTYLYQYTFILLYNVVFTSLPVIVLGAFDQDINAKAALAFPQLYVRGIRGLEYTRTKFWLYMLDGLYQSAVAYFISFCAWSLGLAVAWNGKGIDSLADFGTTISVSAIFAANTYVGINTRYWTVMTWIVVIGSSLVMIAWIIIYSFFESSDFNDEVTVLFGNVTFWATVVVSVVVSLSPRFIVKFLTTSYAPLDRDIVREMWVQGDLKDRLGIEHRSGKKRNLEFTPIFHEPHSRSISESIHNEYEPTGTRSPGSGEVAKDNTLLDTPPRSRADNTDLEMQTHGSHVVTRPSYDMANDITNEKRNPTASWSSEPVSPHPSYYSASDIPLPSPEPSPVYRFTTGEIASNPPSRALSQYTVRSGGPSSPPRSPPAPRLPYNLQPPRQQHGSNRRSDNISDPGTFEMRIRSPPHSPLFTPMSREASDISHASYATAQEDEDWVNSGYEHEYEPPAQLHERSQYPLEDDQVTVTTGDRLSAAYIHNRPLSGSSWNGGRAL